MDNQRNEELGKKIESLLLQGLTQTETAKRLGVSATTVSVWAGSLCLRVHRKHAAVTPELKEEIIRRFSAGETASSIAELFGLEVYTVLHVTSSAGIYRYKRSRRTNTEERDLYAEEYRSGLTVSEIAERHGLTPNQVLSSGFYIITAPRARTCDLGGELFARADYQFNKLSEVSKEYAERYKNMIANRARQVISELGVNAPKEARKWAKEKI